MTFVVKRHRRRLSIFSRVYRFDSEHVRLCVPSWFQCLLGELSGSTVGNGAAVAPDGEAECDVFSGGSIYEYVGGSGHVNVCNSD